MLYNFNKETFKIVSSGWTFIGKYKTTGKAENAAKQYSN